MEGTVFLGLPTYNGEFRKEASKSAQVGSNRFQVLTDIEQWSALPYCFNQIWCKVLNLREKYNIQYFAMLHSDIEVEDYWVDKLVKILETQNLDLVGVVSAIKDSRGLTSTGLIDFQSGKCNKRLTLKEIAVIKKTVKVFDIWNLRELGFASHQEVLGVNTGCFVMRVDQRVTQKFNGEYLSFKFKDWVEYREEEGVFVPQFIPEDWDWSLQLSKRGYRIAATAGLRLDHYGLAKYSNQGDNGLEEDDLQ